MDSEDSGVQRSARKLESKARRGAKCNSGRQRRSREGQKTAGGRATTAVSPAAAIDAARRRRHAPAAGESRPRFELISCGAEIATSQTPGEKFAPINSASRAQS